MMISSDLLEVLIKFRREREWEQFHTPKNLSAALSVEAAELLQIFQWVADAEVQKLTIERQADIAREVADIAILLTLFAHDLGLDIEECVKSKVEENEKKYPADKSRGRSAKYDRL